MGTLAVVEDPGPESQSAEEHDNDAVPITSSVYATIKHLYASAGPWFWLRGAFYFLIHRAALYQRLGGYLPELEDRSMFVRYPFYYLFGQAVANWQTTWVHAVISQPST